MGRPRRLVGATLGVVAVVELVAATVMITRMLDRAPAPLAVTPQPAATPQPANAPAPPIVAPPPMASAAPAVDAPKPAAAPPTPTAPPEVEAAPPPAHESARGRRRPAPASLRSRPITDPIWIRRPNARKMAELYPSQPRKLGLDGRVTLDCGVTAAGRLHACEVVDEHPRGLGFGSAALNLAPYLQIAGSTRSGEPVAGRRLRVPIRWRLDD